MSKRNGPRTRIKAALRRATSEVRSVGQSTDEPSSVGHRYAGGLASEGYAGGYAAALRDVLLVLNGLKPSSSWGFWNDWTDGGDE